MRALLSIKIGSYRIGDDPARNGEITKILLEGWFEAMTRTNQIWMRANPRSPLLYASGVRYKRDPERGPIGITELWLDAPSILGRGFDDCEGLAAFLAAELRTRSPNSEGRQKRPLAYVKLKTTRTPGLLHARVYDPETNEYFDPSRALGMGKNRDG